MSTEFQYDVFLSHSSKDKAVVRPLAERLRKDGLKVWFDEWQIKPGDSIPAKIEEGLEHSCVLACPSIRLDDTDAQCSAVLRFIKRRSPRHPAAGRTRQHNINFLLTD
jgi:hypothetical protein